MKSHFLTSSFPDTVPKEPPSLSFSVSSQESARNATFPHKSTSQCMPRGFEPPMRTNQPRLAPALLAHRHMLCAVCVASQQLSQPPSPFFWLLAYCTKQLSSGQARVLHIILNELDNLGNKANCASKALLLTFLQYSKNGPRLARHQKHCSPNHSPRT